MDIKIIYEDNNVLVIDKPAGMVVFHEVLAGSDLAITVTDMLLKQFPYLKNVGEAPRYGIVHRLDKDTSGVLLVAKTPEALIFLQKQFSAHTFSSIGKSWDGSASGGKSKIPLDKFLEKRYIALVTGVIKQDSGAIKTFIGRSPGDPRKQAVLERGEREAITDWKVLSRYARSGEARQNSESYTLLEINMKTGRKHQIRAHLAHIHHPVAGDKLYGFKDSHKPQGLERQFLHASYLKIQLPSGQTKEFGSELPEELQTILNNLK